MNDFQFHKTTLENGLRVLTERREEATSATLGVWIQAGSVFETDNERGLAHLLEHLVFKGTQRHGMKQIASLMDNLGGQMNAFTERELVCYHVKVLPDHVEKAMGLLCDFIARPSLNKSDLEIERGVVLEEIHSVEDAPEELVEDVFTETIWEKSRWGRPILGTEESVSALQADDLRRYLQTHYTTNNVLISATGDVRHEQIVKLSQKLLSDLPQVQSSTRKRATTPKAPFITSHQKQLSRETEQVHLCIGTKSCGYEDERRYVAGLLDSILTGGYSSRLFQEVREKRGLCYSIGPMSASYRNAAFWAVETSVAPPMAKKTVEIIGRELRKVKEQGVTKAELKRAQEMARINLLLSEESSGSRMNRLARNELYYGVQRSTQDVLAQVQAVTLDDIQSLAREMFDPTLMNLVAIGPFSDKAALLQIEVG